MDMFIYISILFVFVFILYISEVVGIGIVRTYETNPLKREYKIWWRNQEKQ